MTQAELKARVSALTGETNEDILLTFIQLAADKVIAKAYPFDPTVTEVPDRYQGVQLEIAVYMLNKRGAEGETSHNENGVNRSYEAASVPDSMLKGVIPFGKVLGG